MRVQSLDWEDPLEEGMATHSSILAWTIPWTEEPGGLQSMGLQSRTRLERLSMQHAKHTRGFLLETWSLETGVQVPQMTAVPSAWAGQVLLFAVYQLCLPWGGSQGPGEGRVTRRAQI